MAGEHQSQVGIATRSVSLRAILAAIQPWWQAARPQAFPMILLPLLIGQALVLDAGVAFSWQFCAYAALFGAAYQIYLLYSNDTVDVAVDCASQQHYLSGGSRVIPEGKLTLSQLQRGTRIALTILTVTSAGISVLGQRPWMLAGLVVVVGLSWAYHHPPLRLSYRGHGEILQGLGCGIVLPLLGYYLQHGDLQLMPWGALLPLFLVFYAGNIVTALPDVVSDAEGNKRTFPVRYGQAFSRQAALVVLGAAYLSLGLLTPEWSSMSVLVVAGPALGILMVVVFSDLAAGADVARFSRSKAFVGLVSLSQAVFLLSWLSVLCYRGMA